MAVAAVILTAFAVLFILMMAGIVETWSSNEGSLRGTLSYAPRSGGGVFTLTNPEIIESTKQRGAQKNE